jgi:hypothetical protein
VGRGRREEKWSEEKRLRRSELERGSKGGSVRICATDRGDGDVAFQIGLGLKGKVGCRSVLLFFVTFGSNFMRNFEVSFWFHVSID